MTLHLKDCGVYHGDNECSSLARKAASEPGKPRSWNIAVQVSPLENLLECVERTTVDLWSLDVEGVESMIVEAFPFGKIEVGMMVIEMNKSEDNNKNIEQVMKTNGFKECGNRNGDRYYVNPSYFKKRGMHAPNKC